MKAAHKDITYVVASKLGSIGMGSTAYHAIKGVDKEKKLTYRIYCRGYDQTLNLSKKNVYSYGFLETLSLPLRFLEKKLGVKINPFKYVNALFAKLVTKSLPRSNIYHTWMHVAPQAIIKAKKQGATLCLEGANSHPLNVLDILNEEYKLLGKKEYLEERKKVEEQSKIYELFDYVMCPSDFVYDSFAKYGFPKQKLIKMPYGVNPKEFKKKKKKDKTIRFVFVGSIQVRKGLHYLLQAWNELKLENAELVLVGRVWPDSFDIVEKYKQNKSIIFAGFDKNPRKFLTNADVFISPSLEEGSALTCYEAMASSLPLIATYNTGSIARDGKEGFIIPIRDVAALKEKIKYCYDNPQEVAKMGMRARKRAEIYTWDNYSERLKKQYQEIINEKTKK